MNLEYRCKFNLSSWSMQPKLSYVIGPCDRTFDETEQLSEGFAQGPQTVII